MSDINQQFETLGAYVSREASDVECAPEEYQEGLKTIIHILETDLRTSEETNNRE